MSCGQFVGDDNQLGPLLHDSPSLLSLPPLLAMSAGFSLVGTYRHCM